MKKIQCKELKIGDVFIGTPWRLGDTVASGVVMSFEDKEKEEGDGRFEMKYVPLPRDTYYNDWNKELGSWLFDFNETVEIVDQDKNYETMKTVKGEIQLMLLGS